MTATLGAVAAATAEVLVDGRRDGSAVLVDDRHLLTAGHVVEPALRAPAVPLSVRFPGHSQELHVDHVALPVEPGDDVALLRLRGTEAAPVNPVELAPGRRLPEAVKVFGFPHAERAAVGVWRDLRVSGSTTASTVQLDWLDEGSLPGQSGGPVVAPDARLVGIVVEGSESARFDRFLSLNRVEALWKELRRPWLYVGQAARAHVRTRALGQQGRLRGGDLFRGRRVTLRTIQEWLHPDAPTQVLVVTGQPGAGKSAVLGRAALAAEAEGLDGGRLTGLVLHARAATAPELIDALGDVLGLPRTFTEDDLFHELDRLDGPEPVAVLVDALDEAASLADSRSMAAVLADLAQLPWIRVVVATRPMSDADRFADGGLLATLGVSRPSAPNLIDLDRPPHVDQEGLRQVASALLAQEGVTRPATPGAAWTEYRQHVEVRERLAAVIAQRADRSFLVAALTAGLLAQQEAVQDPADPGFDPRQLPSGVGDALSKYLDLLPPGRRVVRKALLNALAHARGAGLDDRLWLRFTCALGYPVGQADLDELRDGPAVDFLLSSTVDGAERSTRLFHQALVDQLLRHRPSSDHAAVHQALVEDVHASGGWHRSRYGRWHAAEHASAAGCLPDLLGDLDFLAVAEPRRLATVVRVLEPSRLRAAVLRALEVLRDPDTPDRASYIALAGMVEGETAWHGADLRAASWTPRWAFWSNRSTGDLIASVGSAVTGLSVHGRGGRPEVMACASGGSVVAVDVQQEQVLWRHGLQSGITMAASSDDGSVLAVCLADGRVVGYDVDRGEEVWQFQHPERQPWAVAVRAVGGRCVVATGTYGEGRRRPWEPGVEDSEATRQGVLRLWHPARGRPAGPGWTRDLFGSGIASLEFLVSTEQLLVGGDPFGEPPSQQCVARVLDAGTGQVLVELPAERGDVRALATTAGRHTYAVTAQSVLRWDVETGQVLRRPSPVQPGPPEFVAAALHRGRAVVVLGAYGELVAVDGETLRRVNAPFTAYEPLAALAMRDGASAHHPALLFTGDSEGAVRSWSVDRLLQAEPSTLAKVVRAAADATTGTVVAVVDHPPPALEVRDVADGRLLRSANLLPTVIRALPGGGAVVLGDEDGRITVRRLPDLEEVWSACVHAKPVTDLRVWGGTVLSVGYDHCLRWSSLSDGHALLDPRTVLGWRDKGLSSVEVVAGTEPGQATVFAAGGAFGLASWRLTARPEADEYRLDPGPLIHLRSQGDRPLVQCVHWGPVALLACVDEPEDTIVLRPVTTPRAGDQSLSWRAHSRRITAIAQHGARLWTADSSGHLAVWAVPDTWDARTLPRLLTDVRLGVDVVDVLPIGQSAAVVATRSGLVTIDVTDGGGRGSAT